MICRPCLHRTSRALRRSARPPLLPRPFSFFAASRAQDAATPTFSTPLLKPDGAQGASAAPAALSSCPEGTILTGLNYLKGRDEPVALADSAYPDWLWRCLETSKPESALGDEGGDEFSKSKKQRRLATKRRAAEEARLVAAGNLEALAPKIPLQHQSINLPGSPGDGIADSVAAGRERAELKKAMRRERRAKIKEANYLKSM